MRRVFIATPCYDGKVDVWYANSLLQTERLAAAENVEIIPIYMSYDSLVQRARNDCLQLALEMQCDDIVWIDADIEWNPQWFFDLLAYDVDVVGGTYRKKTDSSESYVVNAAPSAVADTAGELITVNSLGTGFLRMSRAAMQYLWDVSEPYTEAGKPQEKRMAFDIVVSHGELKSEDVVACEKLKLGGFEIYLDPTMTCNHIGMKKFQGDFNSWRQRLSSTE